MWLVWLVAFWAMQAIAQILFKYGTTAPERHLAGFVGGNVFGASSIWLLMLLYGVMNPNLALALGSAGGFLCAQISLAAVFRSSLTGAQIVGMVAVAGGMALFALGTKR